jgi:hypothetical protein
MQTQSRLYANLVCLHRAVLCANCEVISEGSNGHCAACGSQALLSLSRLLGGAETEPSVGLGAPVDVSNSASRYLSAAA